MVSFTRKIDEAVVIGGDVYVRVVAIGPRWVRFCIDAPKDVRVDREEIHLRRQAEAETDALRERLASVPECPTCTRKLDVTWYGSYNCAVCGPVSRDDVEPEARYA